MLHEMNVIDNPTIRESIKCDIITLIINIKQKFGLGLSKKAEKMQGANSAGEAKEVRWTDQLAEELHKPV
jgi:hypothetical protein